MKDGPETLGSRGAKIFHRLLTTGYSFIFRRTRSQSETAKCLPIHINPASGLAAEVESGLHPPRALHLLVCIDTIKQVSELHHKDVGNISCDRELFGLLRMAYFQHRETLRSILSLRAIRSIKFVKVSLRSVSSS